MYFFNIFTSVVANKGFMLLPLDECHSEGTTHSDISGNNITAFSSDTTFVPGPDGNPTGKENI